MAGIDKVTREQRVLWFLEDYYNIHGGKPYQGEIDPHKRYDSHDREDQEARMIETYHSVGRLMWHER